MKAAEYFNNGYSCSESIIMEAIEKGLVPEELLPLQHLSPAEWVPVVSAVQSQVHK